MEKVGYARVSTHSQHEDSQVDILTEYGVDKLFVDKVSGRLASRPEWDKCIDYLRPGDQLVVTRLSRMARSVRNLTKIASDLHEEGKELVVLKQQIDTTTPTGRFMFHVLAAMDEFLADLIREGTYEGLEAARARGKVGGRPPALTAKKMRLAREMYDSKRHTVKEIAETLGCSRATIYRVLEDT